MKKGMKMLFEGTPELPNAVMYKHWAIKRKNAVKWKNLVYHECVQNKLAGLALDKARLTFIRHGSKAPDFDNLVSSFKACQDGLVFANVIVDDKEINIGQPSYRFEYRSRKHGTMTEIIIEWEED